MRDSGAGCPYSLPDRRAALPFLRRQWRQLRCMKTGPLT